MAKTPSTLDTRTASKAHSISDVDRAATKTTLLSLYLLISFSILFVLLLTQTLQIPLSFTPTPTPTPSESWTLSGLVNMTTTTVTACTTPTTSVVKEARNNQLDLENGDLVEKIRLSVTFLPLKDLRYANKPMDGHTWFMSSMYDVHDEGEVLYMKFPSESSMGRVLCLKGNDMHDGSQNGYALAWRDALPPNATYLEGLTFVAYSHYIYGNPCHGLSAVHPFVAWHQMNRCGPGPDRWVLYYWGELRTEMGPWLNNITEATFDRPTNIESFDGVKDPVCFEEAVVIRHGQRRMSRERMMEAYDLMRCKARKYCRLGTDRGLDLGASGIGLTMFMRTGPRSFKNETAVVGTFQRECDKVDGCRLTVAHSNNLNFCKQVEVMSKTDILVSPHGAQMTNMFLMDRNSSVMEFFPKGFHLMGVGQYVYHWMASWSGMRHVGAWRDPEGGCPYPEDDPKCFEINKNGRIGHNETYFAEWARTVLHEVKIRKTEELSSIHSSASSSSECSCRSS